MESRTIKSICPFCGTKDYDFRNEYSHGAFFGCRVYCNICCALGPLARTRDRAIKLWDDCLKEKKTVK